MSNLFDYNITPGSNNAAAPVGAPENMLPSSVNDTMRQMMANSAAAFTCYTAGGSANAQTVTMSPTLAAYSNKVRIAFIPVASNTGACTLNVNSLGAVDIKMLDGTDPPAGALNSSGVSIVQHNGTNFRLLNPAVNWPTVSGFVSGGRIYRHEGGGNSTALSVSADITESSFESVGPTGSGATNIWTPMDGISSGARIAIISIWMNAVGDEGGSDVELNAYARMTGSSVSAGNENSICMHRFANNNLTVPPEGGVQMEAMVPLDSSRRFDATWSGLNDASREVLFYLRGFVY